MVMDIESVLQGKLGKRDIQEVTEWTSQNVDNREILFSLAFCGSEKVSANALWCLTHLRKSDSQWLQSLQDNLITRVRDNLYA